MLLLRTSFYLWVLLPGLLIPMLVGLLFVYPQSLGLGAWVRQLPAVHATINGATAVVLLMALWAIRKGYRLLHERLMYVCVALGVAFLLSYVLYHGSVPSVRYGDLNGDGWLSAAEEASAFPWRFLYLCLLFSHIFLSILVVYLVLLALYYARRRAFERHRGVVRYAFPIWWYVSVSGVLVYFMIRPFYG